MNKFFEVNAKYVKMDLDGREKKVSEQFLVDALTCSEAESRTIAKLKECISGEFNVVKIAQSNIGDIVDSENGDRWFKAKVGFISIDEETGKEKRIIQYMLVFSDTVQNADSEIKNAMKSLMAEFVIVSISESPILEVWPYLEAVPTTPHPLEGLQLKATNEMIPVEIKRAEGDIIRKATYNQELITVVLNGDGLWEDVSNMEIYNADELVFDPEPQKIVFTE